MEAIHILTSSLFCVIRLRARAQGVVDTESSLASDGPTKDARIRLRAQYSKTS